MNNKIFYKKISDYENSTLSTNSNISNLDNSVLTLNDNIGSFKTNGTNYDSEINVQLFKNINNEITDNIKEKLNVEIIDNVDNNTNNTNNANNTNNTYSNDGEIDEKLKAIFDNFLIKKNLSKNESIKKIIKTFETSEIIKNLNEIELENILKLFKKYLVSIYKTDIETKNCETFNTVNVENNFKTNKNVNNKNISDSFISGDLIKNKTLLEKLSSNDINSWIFVGTIIISIIIMIMIIINNK